MNIRPLSLKGGAACSLMIFHAILRQILKYRFCAISSRELSVCAIFYAFYNYVLNVCPSAENRQQRLPQIVNLDSHNMVLSQSLGRLHLLQKQEAKRRDRAAKADPGVAELNILLPRCKDGSERREPLTDQLEKIQVVVGSVLKQLKKSHEGPHLVPLPLNNDRVQ